MQKLRVTVKTYWPYLVAVLAIVAPWLFRSGYLFLTDFVWGPHTTIDWRESWALIDVIEKALSFVVPTSFIQKLFVSGALLAVVLGGKKIAEQFVTERWLVFALSLFTLFNPFVYDRMGYGQIGMVAGVGFLCLTIGALLSASVHGNKGEFVNAGLWTGLAVISSVHYVFFAALAWLALLIVTVVTTKRTEWAAIAKRVGIAIAIVVAINLNWLVANATGASSTASFVQQQFGHQDLVAFQTAGNGGWQALGLVVRLSGFWGKDQQRYADLAKVTPDWGRSFLVLLPLVIWGVVTGFRSKKKPVWLMTSGLVALGGVAIVLAVGIKTPGAREITYWLFDHFPFYKGLRETQKWVALLVSVYAVFLAVGVSELIKLKPVAKYLKSAIVILGFIIVLQAPLLIWGMHGQVAPHEYPAEWYAADGLMKNAGCNGSVLVLPWHLYMGYEWAGAVIANPAGRFFSCPVISGHNMEWAGIYSESGDANDTIVRWWVDSKGKLPLLTNGKQRFGYLFLAKESDWKKYSWLSSDPDVKLVLDAPTYMLYEVVGTKK